MKNLTSKFLMFVGVCMLIKAAGMMLAMWSDDKIKVLLLHSPHSQPIEVSQYERDTTHYKTGNIVVVSREIEKMQGIVDSTWSIVDPFFVENRSITHDTILDLNLSEEDAVGELTPGKVEFRLAKVL